MTIAYSGSGKVKNAKSPSARPAHILNPSVGVYRKSGADAPAARKVSQERVRIAIGRARSD